jgi:hypothetical protein
MPNFNQSTRNMMESMIQGLRVDRATAALPQSTSDVLFNVEGGRILMNLILGVVTTDIGNVANVAHLESDPDTGTATELCLGGGGTDIDDDEEGTLYSISGTPGDGLQVGMSGNVIGQAASVIVAPGEIELHCAGSSVTGSIQWSIWYIPLETGAYVTAA